jgi:hypothetical protein
MAELDTPDFKFPDEIEAAADKEEQIETADNNIIIEIENEVPPEDQNRVPIPETEKEELYKDDLQGYSLKVKNKLIRMKALAHDERREKERVFRENQEAVALANRLIEENRRLKQSLIENQDIAVQNISKNVEYELQKAKEDYRKAYESGDTDQVLEAQQKIAEVTLKIDKVRNFKPQALPPEQPYVPIAQTQVRQQQPEPDPTAVSWAQKNPWWGQNKQMTALALATHQEMVENGDVMISSPEYYRRLDETVRKRFPDYFGESETERQPRSNSVVAPATRSTSPKQIRLKPSQVALAKKLGISLEDYAKAVNKLES